MLKKIRSYMTVTMLLPVLAGIIALSWVWSTVSVMQRNFAFQQQVDELEQEIALLELRNKTIQYQIEYFKTNEFAELAAREDLNKAAEGEKVLVLPSSEFESEATVAAANPKTKQFSQSNFQQWMFFLFGQRADKQ